MAEGAAARVSVGLEEGVGELEAAAAVIEAVEVEEEEVEDVAVVQKNS